MKREVILYYAPTRLKETCKHLTNIINVSSENISLVAMFKKRKKKKRKKEEEKKINKKKKGTNVKVMYNELSELYFHRRI